MLASTQIPLLTSNFVYIGGGKRVTGNARYLWLGTIFFVKVKNSLYVTERALFNSEAEWARVLASTQVIIIF